jgi:hypothetical protein
MQSPPVADMYYNGNTDRFHLVFHDPSIGKAALKPFRSAPKISSSTHKYSVARTTEM